MSHVKPAVRNLKAFCYNCSYMISNIEILELSTGDATLRIDYFPTLNECVQLLSFSILFFIFYYIYFIIYITNIIYIIYITY